MEVCTRANLTSGVTLFSRTCRTVCSQSAGLMYNRPGRGEYFHHDAFGGISRAWDFRGIYVVAEYSKLYLVVVSQRTKVV
jgi:hypothetical protein